MATFNLHRRLALGRTLGGLLSGLGAAALAQDSGARPLQLPALTLPDLDGANHDLSALRGRVVMINFWATWCPPCRAEMPSIEQLHRSMQGKDFVVLGINQGESAEKIKAKLGLFSPPPSFALLVDARSEVGAYFKVKDLPTSLIFNKQGLLSGVADGARDFSNAAVRQTIEALLKA
jgi:thiol-disulfide isomerase/thioredoxin